MDKRRTYARWRQRLCHLSPQAARVLQIGLGLWCWLLLCAAVLLVRGWPYSMESYGLFVRAAQLQEAAYTVCFCTGFLACFLEERSLK